MAILSLPSVSKGSPAVLALQLDELLALTQITDSFFTDYTNLARVDVNFKSSPGNQHHTVKFDVSGVTNPATPVNASLVLSSKARDVHQINFIRLVDLDGGNFIIDRVSMPSSLTNASDINLGYAGPSGDGIAFDTSLSGDSKQGVYTKEGTYTHQAFSFTSDEIGKLSAVDFRLRLDAADSGTLVAKVYANNSGVIGSLLATSAAKDINTLTVGGSYVWSTFSFDGTVMLNAQDYFVVIQNTSALSNSNVFMHCIYTSNGSSPTSYKSTDGTSFVVRNNLHKFFGKVVLV